jgi:hypothetical protein
MKTLLAIMMLALCAIACGQEVPDNPNVDPRIEFFPLRITARIVDEIGIPIEGANVDVGIGNLRYKDQLNNIVGKSDSEGKFTAESMAVAAYVHLVVSKDGYYISRKLFEGMENDPEKVRKVGRFEPWDPTVDIVLKKIGKPIPMLARLGNSSKKLIPDMASDFPFDLMAWDWLPPHGKGRVADLLIRVDERKEGEEIQSRSLQLRFSNEHDGLIPIMKLHGVESVLKSPRTAPENGYEMRELTIAYQKGQIISYEDLDKLPKGYFFRIRTQVNAAGEVVSAYYGKIIQTNLTRSAPPLIRYNCAEGSRKADFMFSSCYINPTPNERNLEYDQESNLVSDDYVKGATFPP